MHVGISLGLDFNKFVGDHGDSYLIGDDRDYRSKVVEAFRIVIPDLLVASRDLFGMGRGANFLENRRQDISDSTRV
jgi:hypothetical protein